MRPLVTLSLLILFSISPSVIDASPEPRTRNEKPSSNFEASKRHRSVRPRKSITHHFGKVEQVYPDYDYVPEEINASKGSPTSRRAQQREVRRERRRQRKQARKDLVIEERLSSAPRNRRREQRQRMRETTLDMSWLAANVSSLWEVVRRLEETVSAKHQHQHRTHSSGSPKHSSPSRNRGGKSDRSEDHSYPLVSSAPEVVHPSNCQENACIEFPGARVCSGAGTCESCNCKCDEGHYGVYCHCNDNSCDWHNGMLCGGPKHGQCRCGQCVCRPNYTGSACECTMSNDTCIHPESQTICSNHGNCQCGVCKCYDEYGGRYCEETVYAAGVCERLKPCVQCRAFNLDLPQCSQCEVIVNLVDEIEPNLKTCVMVGSGCFLQYSYIRQGPSAYTVLVRREDKCISQKKP